MSSKSAKKTTKKPVKVEHSDDDVDQELEEERALDEAVKKMQIEDKFETNEHDTPKVVEGASTTEPKSIIDFDHDEIRKFDVEHTKAIDDLMLLKILIVRGKDGHNPALWSGTQRLLRQLNFEVDRGNGGRFREFNRAPRFDGPRRGGYQPRAPVQTQQPLDEVRQPYQERQERREDFGDREDAGFGRGRGGYGRGGFGRGGFGRRGDFGSNFR